MNALFTRRNVLKSLGLILLLGVGSGLYFYFQPHRNVQETKTDFAYQSSDIVNEYLSNADAANQKYLDEQGESKVIEVSGKISDIQENFNGNLVVVLTGDKSPAGVSCTFLPGTSVKKENLHVGDLAVIKGVIRSGASYDSDLDMYENVLLEDCDLIK